MSDNRQKYDSAFIETFSTTPEALANDLAYNTIPEWDSIGHISLISALEEAFDISMETDDIIEFGSYTKGIAIIAKYGVVI